MAAAGWRRFPLAVGVLSIALGAFEGWWTLHAFDASLHLGSPIRRIAPADVEALALDPDLQHKHLRPLLECFGASREVIGALSDTLHVLALSSIFLVVIGIVLIRSARQDTMKAAPDPPSPGVAQ
jgi:hypothetical protein